MSKPDKPAAEPTEYVVLRRIRAENTEAGSLTEQLERVATVTARSAEGAIRQAAVSEPGVQVLVAIPVRSFRPVTVTAEVQTKLKLESL